MQAETRLEAVLLEEGGVMRPTDASGEEARSPGGSDDRERARSSGLVPRGRCRLAFPQVCGCFCKITPKVHRRSVAKGIKARSDAKNSYRRRGGDTSGGAWRRCRRLGTIQP